MLTVILQSVVLQCHYAECHYAECHYAECRYAVCRLRPTIYWSVKILKFFVLKNEEKEKG